MSIHSVAALRSAILSLSLTAVAVLPGGCSSSRPEPESSQEPRPVAEREGDQAYRRGTTDYSSGKAEVTEGNVRAHNRRSFEGIRVAGPDTDVLPDYWDDRLSALGHSKTFELFESRLKDLEVLQTGADIAALESFESWCKRRAILPAFQRFHGK